jgi:glutaminase
VRVGLPAKSGVSGTLIAASPGRFGAAVFSPPLDPTGNPVRGTVALRELSGRFALHLMHVPAPGASMVVSESAPGLVTARGVLDFTGTERVLYALSEQAAALPTSESLTLDLRLVTRTDSFAAALLRAAVERLGAEGRKVTVVKA